MTNSESSPKSNIPIASKSIQCIKKNDRLSRHWPGQIWYRISDHNQHSIYQPHNEFFYFITDPVELDLTLAFKDYEIENFETPLNLPCQLEQDGKDLKLISQENGDHSAILWAPPPWFLPIRQLLWYEFCFGLLGFNANLSILL